MPGIGGTGVVTVSQILQMAALLDGKHAYGLDQTGLAQKGGPVTSDIRISRDRIEGSLQRVHLVVAAGLPLALLPLAAAPSVAVMALLVIPAGMFIAPLLATRNE